MTKTEKGILQDMIQDVVGAFEEFTYDLSLEDEFWDAMGKLQDYVHGIDAIDEK